ncbi:MULTISPECIES: phage tail sheath subtilisin-like domain-containing protein [Micromonospora]|uniref:Phage tail protein n=1 Tax=Micromonospora maris TaxID=1003110 RepID=A0A9X0I1U6_9ACTN|nr:MULTISPECIES: phage tail sheath subtilisin-like domain-containing protein [Micromonospora]AEB45871.1 phage tail sheath family protein [Micromonospora maris AB-18-032]KUJ45193.1 phage tail protein [Micromonospora maris]RUL94761.1 phage tail sheath family protein [Verrucosispora sp. FIM060022]WSK41256.1 phage tail sheath subtilisin-like domain-containing protein [Micromonospora maris]
MPTYFSPGIYVEEVPGAARPIGPAGTSTAAFVGVAPDRTAHLGEALAVNNWTDFLRLYADGDDFESTPLARAVFGFLDNGGTRCWVVNVGEGGSVTGTGRKRAGLDLLEAVDEISIVATPGFHDPVSHEALLSLAERTRSMVAICDPPPDIDDISTLTRVATPGSTRPAKPADTADPDTPGSGGSGGGSGGGGPVSYRPRQSDYGALYYPWLRVRDPLSGDLVLTPPSGHVAGIWARTDALRGVHKAPANEPVRGAVDLGHLVTRAEHDVLNPKGVNVIRYFPGEGIRVWGARTLAAEASEWRYLNVRRLSISIEQAIANGTRWMVFEPNDFTLWRSIRRDIGAFLTRVWRDGALLGRTPEEAFFVKCDEETNPADVRDAGMVVAHIGIAVVKPAEFVVFKLSQWAGGTETETIGG